jgi:hypothetical protein
MQQLEKEWRTQRVIAVDSEGRGDQNARFARLDTLENIQEERKKNALNKAAAKSKQVQQKQDTVDIKVESVRSKTAGSFLSVSVQDSDKFKQANDFKELLLFNAAPSQQPTLRDIFVPMIGILQTSLQGMKCALQNLQGIKEVTPSTLTAASKFVAEAKEVFNAERASFLSGDTKKTYDNVKSRIKSSSNRQIIACSDDLKAMDTQLIELYSELSASLSEKGWKSYSKENTRVTKLISEAKKPPLPADSFKVKAISQRKVKIEPGLDSPAVSEITDDKPRKPKGRPSKKSKLEEQEEVTEVNQQSYFSLDKFLLNRFYHVAAKWWEVGEVGSCRSQFEF